jgi:uncharacterized phage protein (TIGR02216 family)
MSERFGPAACRLAGLASRMLGWSPDQFWTSTPAELTAALSPSAPPASLERADLNRLMERDNG